MTFPTDWVSEGFSFDMDLNVVPISGPRCMLNVVNSNFYTLSQWGKETTVGNKTGYNFTKVSRM